MRFDNPELTVPYSLVAGAIFLAVLVYLYCRHRDSRRVRTLASECQRLDMSFDPKPEGSLPSLLRRLPFFKRPWQPRFRNLAQGEFELGRVLFFDYHFFASSPFRNNLSQSSSFRRQSMLAVHLENVQIADFELHPKYGRRWLGSLVRRNTLTFEDSPRFNRHYLLSGDSETKVRRQTSKAFRDKLDELALWSIEGRGRWLLFFRSGQRVRAQNLEALLEESKFLAVHLLPVRKRPKQGPTTG